MGRTKDKLIGMLAQDFRDRQQAEQNAKDTMEAVLAKANAKIPFPFAGKRPKKKP